MTSPVTAPAPGEARKRTTATRSSGTRRRRCHYVDLLLWLLGDPVRGTHLGTRLRTP